MSIWVGCYDADQKGDVGIRTSAGQFFVPRAEWDDVLAQILSFAGLERRFSDLAKRSALVQHINQASIDTNIHIVIDCPDRPRLMLYIANTHGRRTLSVSLDGMSTFSGLVDLAQMPPAGGRMPMFCAYCGEKLVMTSSRPHACTNEFD